MIIRTEKYELELTVEDLYRLYEAGVLAEIIDELKGLDSAYSLSIIDLLKND